MLGGFNEYFEENKKEIAVNFTTTTIEEGGD
jgi:hypothetical protein